MKVAIADPIHEDGASTLEAAGVTVVPSPLDGEELRAALTDAQGLVVRSATRVTPELLDAAPELKVVGRAGVGVDNIDLDACRQRGIAVVNTPAATSNAVAELTIAHMLALARHLPRATAGMREGRWEKKELRGSELDGRTLGLLGIGRIGSRVAKLATAFGMDVVAFDAYVDDGAIREMGFRPVGSPAELAASCDVVSVHVPLTPDTRHIVDAEFLSNCREGVTIINCARGGVVDETALLDALRSGRVAGAGLDVFETEPPGDSELLQHPNVSLTPHIGAATNESQSTAGVQVAEGVLAVLNGKEPEYRVV